MYSLHKLKHQQRTKAISDHRLKLLHPQSRSPGQDSDSLTLSYKKRLKSYCDSISPGQQERNSQTVIKTGAIPLIPASFHQFREDCRCPKIYINK
jgi:uncharacterized protein